MNLDSLKTREERKRERNWNPVIGWQVIQDTITWAERQPVVRRRHTASARLREQQRKLA